MPDLTELLQQAAPAPGHGPDLGDIERRRGRLARWRAGRRVAAVLTVVVLGGVVQGLRPASEVEFAPAAPPAVETPAPPRAAEAPEPAPAHPAIPHDDVGPLPVPDHEMVIPPPVDLPDEPQAEVATARPAPGTRGTPVPPGERTQAEPPRGDRRRGCVAVLRGAVGDHDGEPTCTYTATVRGGYRVDGPADWRITVRRGDETSVFTTADSPSCEARGVIKRGDYVIVEIFRPEVGFLYPNGEVVDTRAGAGYDEHC